MKNLWTVAFKPNYSESYQLVYKDKKDSNYWLGGSLSMVRVMLFSSKKKAEEEIALIKASGQEIWSAGKLEARHAIITLA